MMSKIHANIKIYGLVQGVTFRYSAKNIADKLNVKGFAKNETDGSVYIEAEGAEKKLTEFVAWCHHGPSRAKVEKVDIDYSNEIKNYKIFESVHKRDNLN